jgi:beta-mannosidase
MAAEPDLLASVAWQCAATLPGEAAAPGELATLPLRWLPARVPGTAAGALRDAGLPEPSAAELDGRDWWFRCRLPNGVPVGPFALRLEGLATVADVWLDGAHLAHSASMFAPVRVPVGECRDGAELCIRFAALAPLLAERRPRPRWKSPSVAEQNLRWFRTTLLGRQSGWTVTPAPVGPWRPVRLERADAGDLLERRVLTECREDGTGTVSFLLRWAGRPDADRVTVEVAGTSVQVPIRRTSEHAVAEGSAVLGQVARWWPHTHGDQPLYPAAARLAGETVDLGAVGFRTVTVDTAGDGFELAVNGTPVFCRGACWYPPDPVSFVTDDEELVATLELARRGGMNMVRVPGGTVYETDRFFDACDRLGLMVWQDTMLAFLDPPDDDGYAEAVRDEVTRAFSSAAAHPSLAVVCGGQELEEQPAMLGLDRDRWEIPLVSKVVAGLASTLAPGVPYLTSSPSGGPLPFRPDHGVSHYTGVGVFTRGLDDLRRATPRFVSEGLAFSIPPEATSVEQFCGGPRRAGHDPSWKRAIHHDTGGSWDLEDVRDHYVRRFFDVDPALLRRTDPERALDLGRAAVAHVMGEAMSEWRRGGSPCAGFLLVALRDLRMGAGWGVLDARGRPKAPWFAVARTAAPVAVLVTDEGLNGLTVHVVNDTPEPVDGELTVELATARHRVEAGGCRVEVPARGSVAVSADSLFTGFRDLAYAYRFGPRAYELVTATLAGVDGRRLSRAAYLPGGLVRAREEDVGLWAELHNGGPSQRDGAHWQLTVSARNFAQFVSIDAPGFVPGDSWFHLAPGEATTVILVPDSSAGTTPSGHVRALNAVASARIVS